MRRRKQRARIAWPFLLRSVSVLPVTWTFERVVLVRHGETEWNRYGRRQGHLDSPLTPEGRRHAETAALLVASTSIDGIFSSPLGRAYQTSLVIAEKIGRQV